MKSKSFTHARRNPFIRYLKASRSRSERRRVRQILRVPLGAGVEMIQ